MHLILNLTLYVSKFLVGLVVVEIVSGPLELKPGVFDSTPTDQLTGRIGHEGRQFNEESDSPWNLQAQGQTPLCLAVRGIATCQAHPVRGHGS